MRNYIYIFFTFFGLMNLFSACEKDETKATMLASPVAPVISTVPDLTLKRVEAAKLLQFSGTTADFGFPSSVTYNLEADRAGNQFKTPIFIASSRVDSFNISVTDFNSLLIKTLPVDETLAMELRVRAVLTIEASGAQPIVAVSEPKAVSITTFGPPTMALTTAGTEQGITSPTDNKMYAGWIYTDGTPFQLTNKDDGKIYGGVLTGDGIAADLVENGPAFSLETGAYNLTADLVDMKTSAKDVTIGIIGDAVGGWDNDTKMVFDFTDRTWNITKEVATGGIKFRTHGGWADVNVAYDPAAPSLNNLYQSNTRPNTDSQDIRDIAPGTYNIKLFLETTPMKVVFTPAN
ncbi:MAG TPA: SusE domain-containing protein [Prolixibacteraceae bacterium]|nr:SusE domain-containing protein [Prolixibacteraceae bacterium]